jgi:hypothetical protein
MNDEWRRRPANALALSTTESHKGYVSANKIARRPVEESVKWVREKQREDDEGEKEKNSKREKQKRIPPYRSGLSISALSVTKKIVGKKNVNSVCSQRMNED